MWDYRDLKVWQKARRLVASIYLATADYPLDERFGLTAQTRRATVSVAANLAEGCGRRGRKEFARFVDIAIGSAFELESHLLLAEDLGLTSEKANRPILSEVDEVKRMLIGLSRSLRETSV